MILTDVHTHSDGHSQPGSGYRIFRSYEFDQYGVRQETGPGDEQNVGDQQTDTLKTFVFRDWASI